jgi:hypothetical protein
MAPNTLKMMPPRKSRRPKTSLSSKFTFSPRSDGRGGVEAPRQCPQGGKHRHCWHQPSQARLSSENHDHHLHGTITRTAHATERAKSIGDGHRPCQRKHAPPPTWPGTWQHHHLALEAATPTSTHSKPTPLASQPPFARRRNQRLDHQKRRRRPSSVARLRHEPAGDGQDRRAPTGMQPMVARRSGLHATSAPRSRWVATPHHHRVPEAAASPY